MLLKNIPDNLPLPTKLENIETEIANVVKKVGIQFDHILKFSKGIQTNRNVQNT